MKKIYAPLGYVINKDNGEDYYDANDREELLYGAFNLAYWPNDVWEKITKSTNQELIALFLDNGFELVEDE